MSPAHRFKKGHSFGFKKGHKLGVGRKHTEETKEKMSKSFKEGYKNGSRVSWNKGKTGVFSKEALWKIGGSMRGKRANNWKGGRRINGEGYVEVFFPEHLVVKSKYVMEHRLVIEKKLSRYLKSRETVHHINGNKIDNNVDNLYLFDTLNSHNSYHRNVKKTYKLWNLTK